MSNHQIVNSLYNIEAFQPCNMKNILLLALLCLIYCCNSSELSSEQLNKQITLYAKDNVVSAAELAGLERTILANKEAAVCRPFLNGEDIDKEAVKAYILAQQEGIMIEATTAASESSSTVSSKASYQVYIENSASMDGYVDGLTGFKNDVYELVSDIQSPLREIAADLELYYVNSKVIPFDEDIESFVKKLNPKTFRARGGDRSTTDLSNIIGDILKQVEDNKVGVLISDGVFSPGKGKDPIQFLVNQRIGIKNELEKALSKNRALSAVVLKMQSNFKGTYFDKENNRIPLNDKRPYYIWILGHQQHIQQLLEELNVSEFSEYQHQHIFTSRKIQADYRISTEYRIGSFTFDRTSPLNSIQEAEPSDRTGEKGKFRFSIAVDLKPFGLDESFIQDATNYRISNNDYTIDIQEISRDDLRKNARLEDYTHFLLLETERIAKETLEIELLKSFPAWVEASSSVDDSLQEGAELNKTFGLQYMVEGFANAFDAASEDKEAHFKITINIEK